MVSFRFHLVSLVAVFIALGIGIGMGATVIDKATVDLLHRQLENVRNEVTASNQRSDALQRQLDRASAYENRADDYVLAGKLTNVRILVVGVRGIDEGPVDSLRDSLHSSGADVSGVVWVTSKVRLDDARAVARLQADLAAATTDPVQLRQLLVAKLNALLAGSVSPSTVKPLFDDGFLDWEGDAAGSDWTDVAFDGSRVVAVSGYNASVPNDQIAIPLVRLLAAQPARRVIAVESGRDPDQRTSGERAVFLGPLRTDATLSGRISTVDDLELPAGRVAAVLSLVQLSSGKTGDYGVGSSVSGILPKLAG